MRPFTKGIAVGLVVGHTLVFGAAWVVLPRAYEEATSGWELTSVVVARQDLPVGARLGFSDLSQRDFPAQFVTPAHVAPENISVLINRPIPYALKADEPLVYSTYALSPVGTPAGCE